MDREERLKANSLDHSLVDIPRTSTELTLGSKPTPKHDDPQFDTSLGIGIGTSSADDSADVHQRYELAPCSE